jgi:DNA-binding transcriptional ArsR family regulator
VTNARPFRYEWDGTVRRLKLPPLVKLVAAYVSQYADNEGRHTRPGVERLALETQTSPATVKRCLKKLRDVGLLDLVRSGSSQGRRGKANEYRLAIPEDLLERVELVTEVNVDDTNRDHQVSRDPEPDEAMESTEQGSPDEPCSGGTGLTDDTNRDHQVIPHQPETTPADNTTPDINSLPAPTLTPRDAGQPKNPKIHNPPNCSSECTFCRTKGGRVVLPFRKKAS